jgi:hypothetical protein
MNDAMDRARSCEGEEGEYVAMQDKHGGGV